MEHKLKAVRVEDLVEGDSMVKRDRRAIFVSSDRRGNLLLITADYDGEGIYFLKKFHVSPAGRRRRTIVEDGNRKVIIGGKLYGERDISKTDPDFSRYIKLLLQGGLL